MDFWEKWKPAVTKKWLDTTAGLMWSGVGALLCFLAYRWLRPVPTSRAMLLTLAGVILALIIYSIRFSRLAKNNIRRISNLAGDKICLFAFQEWTSYPLVIVMMSLGIFLRKISPIPKPLLGVMYIGIGSSLFLASLHYYQHIWRTYLVRAKDPSGPAD